MGECAWLFRSAAQSHVGRRRQHNEDSFWCDDELGLWLVADGMGGHAGGEVASRETAEAVFCEVKALREQWCQRSPKESPERAVERAVQTATYQVFGLAEQQDSRGMGTTLSALVFLGGKLVVAQVGDSRIYRFRDGGVQVMTEDHTLTNYQLKRGLITEAEARRSKKRNVITRAVGHRDYVEVDTEVLSLRHGDRYLICSDGLHEYFRDDELTHIVAAGGQPAVDRLVELANERGGKDNITGVVLQVAAAPPSLTAEAAS